MYLPTHTTVIKLALHYFQLLYMIFIKLFNSLKTSCIFQPKRNASSSTCRARQKLNILMISYKFYTEIEGSPHFLQSSFTGELPSMVEVKQVSCYATNLHAVLLKVQSLYGLWYNSMHKLSCVFCVTLFPTLPTFTLHHLLHSNLFYLHPSWLIHLLTGLFWKSSMYTTQYIGVFFGHLSAAGLTQ